MKYKPFYSKQMEHFLSDLEFLEVHGEFILSVLESQHFWQKLKKRVDFLFYAYAQKLDAGVCPMERDSLNTDALWWLVESEISKLKLSYDEFIIDELFREFVAYVKGEHQTDENYIYEYYSAPYLSSLIYEKNPSEGTFSLDQLTEELFHEPLQTIKKHLGNLMNTI